jgi:hypothetical protein
MFSHPALPKHSPVSVFIYAIAVLETFSNLYIFL